MYNLKLNHLIAITTIVAFIIPVSLLTVAVQVAEASTPTMTPGTTTLAESALDGAEIVLTLSGATFNSGVASSNFDVTPVITDPSASPNPKTQFGEDGTNNNPLSVSSVVRASGTEATVTIDFDSPWNNDITADTTFTITLKPAGHSGSSDITTSAITVTADALSPTTADHTISVEAQDSTGTAVTSYSDSTTEIHLPMTWANSANIRGSSFNGFLMTYFNTDEVDAVRFEGAEVDQSVFLHINPQNLAGQLAHNTPTYGPAPTDKTAPTFCSDGTAATGSPLTCASDNPTTPGYCSSNAGDRANICSDNTALPCVSPATEQCSATKNTELRPQSRVFSSSAAVALLTGWSDSSDLKTKFAAGTGIRDVGRNIAIDCNFRAAGFQKFCLGTNVYVPATSLTDTSTTGCPPGTTGPATVAHQAVTQSDQCTYGIGTETLQMEPGSSVTKFARLIIGDIGTEFKNGSICEQSIGFTGNPNGPTTDQDTLMKAAIAADPLTHPAAINAEPFNYCAGVHLSTAIVGASNLNDTPAGSRGVGKLVVTPKASHSGPLTFRAAGRVSGITSAPGRIPPSAVLTLADAKAPVITAPTGNISVSSGAFPITVDEGGTVSMACSSGALTAVLDTHAETGNQNTVPAGTQTSVSIVGGLVSGTSYTDCTVTVTDDAGNASTAKSVGTFTGPADGVAPTLSGISAARTGSTNPLAASDKYAKNGDSVRVTLTFDEQIQAIGTPTFKIGGASGTTVTGTIVSGQTPSSSNRRTTVAYDITVGATHAGAIYVSIPANTITDGVPNTQSSAQTATTSTTDPTANDFFLVDNTAPTAPTAIALDTPSSSPGTDTTPIFTVTGTAGTTIFLFTDSSCTAANRTGTNSGTIAVGDTSTTVETGTLSGTTTIYAGAVDAAGNVGCYATGSSYQVTGSAVTATLTADSPSALTEDDLHTATVDVTLSGGTFNATLTPANFTTTGITGLTVSAATRQTGNTVARLTLAYTNADFDSDDSFTVTVAASEHSGSSSVTTGSLAVTAVVELDAATLALTTDSGSSATDGITNTVASFNVTLPAGQRSNVVSGGTAEVFRYDVVAGACEAPTGLNGGWASHASESDHSGYTSGTGVWVVDGGTNPNDGEHCYTAVYDPDGSGTTHSPGEYSTAVKVETDDTAPTAPTGISVASATGTGATVVVTVTAAANSKVWLYEDSSCATRRGTVEGTVAAGGTDVDITSPNLNTGPNTIYGGVVDTAGNVGCYATGATYTRTAPTASATVAAVNPSSPDETTLDTATVNVTVANTIYEPDATLQTSHFTVDGIAGLTVNSYSRTSNTVVRLTLAFDGTDFDSDDSFTVTVNDSAHTGSGDITTSDSVSVTAVNDPPKGTGLALTTDSGSSATDGITNDASSFEFTVPSGQRSNIVAASTATVYRYNTNAGGTCDTPSSSNSGWQSHATETGTAGYDSGTGVWTVDGSGTNPTDGEHCYTAVYDTDGSTATVDPSHYADAIKVQTDDTAPTAPTAVASQNGTSGSASTITIRVTAAAGTARLYTSSTCATQSGTNEAAISSGTADVETPTLNTGANTFYGGVVDTAGNVACFATGVTYTKSAPAVTATLAAVNPGSLTESNLDNATVDVTISSGTINQTLTAANFTTTGIAGLTVDGAVRQTNTATVRLTLNFDGTDFDSDDSFTVTVPATEHSGSGSITSASLSVTAVNDPPKATGLALETDSGSSATDKITNDATGFSFTVPSAQRASVASGSTATVYIYDVVAGACEAPTGSNGGWASHATETDNTGYSSGTWTVDGGTNPADGEHCYTAVYDLDGSGNTYVPSHYADAIKVQTDDTAPTAPTAVASQNGTSGSASTITIRVTAAAGTARLYTSSTCATQSGTNEAAISSGTADVETPTLNTGANTFYGGVVDTAGNVACFATGVTYTKSAPAVTATLAAVNPGSLTESNLDNATVDVTISSGTINQTLTAANFTTTGIAGLTVDGAVRQTNTATVRLTLNFDGTDFDSDDSFTVTVPATEHSGSGSITSASLSVTAVNDPPKATGLALETDSGSSATDKITNDATGFTFTVPSAQRASVASGSTATVYIYDVVAGACEAPTGSNGGWASHATETDNTGYSSGTWTVDGGTNPADGEHCYTAVYDLDGATATYAPSHYSDAIKVETDDTDPVAPTAVASQDGSTGTASTITVRVTATNGLTARLYSDSTCDTRHGSNEATVTAGSADIVSGTLSSGSNAIYGGVVDTAGNVGCQSLATTYQKTAAASPSATVTAANPSSPDETTLDTATVNVTVANTAYEPDATLQTSHFTVDGIAGLTVNSYSRTSNTVVRLTLAFDGTDFDSDDSFTVTVNDSAHTGSGDITTSDSVSVTAVNDPPKGTGFAH